jgi:hypothetical protein
MSDLLQKSRTDNQVHWTVALVTPFTVAKAAPKLRGR